MSSVVCKTIHVSDDEILNEAKSVVKKSAATCDHEQMSEGTCVMKKHRMRPYQQRNQARWKQKRRLHLQQVAQDRLMSMKKNERNQRKLAAHRKTMSETFANATKSQSRIPIIYDSCKLSPECLPTAYIRKMVRI